MKNIIKLFVTIALVAVIGFSFTTCKDESDSFNGHTLKSGVPSASTLKSYGIPSDALQGLFNAARAINTNDADYQGYYEDKNMFMKMLVFIWFNKTEEKYNATCEELKTQFDTYWEDDLGQYLATGGYPSDVVISKAGVYETTSDMSVCSAQYYLKNYKGISKGTLAVGFSKVDFSSFMNVAAEGLSEK